MLKLEIGQEGVIEEGRKVRFVMNVEYVLQLEHSLASLSKWEEIWEKPFLTKDNKTPEELLSYIECMIVGQQPPEDLPGKLTQKNLDAVNAYINRKMTATWFNEANQAKTVSSETITAELVYYWLSNLPSMPPGFEQWHLNKLFTFIKIHDVKNQPKRKQGSSEFLAERRAENERRRALYGSPG